MKIFTQESVIEEVASGMESNLIKNAFNEQQVDTSHRYQALEKLVEAAELFEKAGNIKKSAMITSLVEDLSNSGKSRSQQIKGKIASLEDAVNELQSAYYSNDNESNRYILDSAANKITGLLSNVTNTTSDILESVANLKTNHASTPNTLKAVSSALDVAKGTLAVVAEDECLAKDKGKKKSKDSKDSDMVEVLKYFGFGVDVSDGSDGDCGDCGDQAKCWED